jgi:iron(III) transport system substrate-binding protein
MWTRRFIAIGVAASAALVFWLGIVHADDSLVLYSGRSQGLVEPILKEFEQETGIRVRAKYGTSAQLSLALREEGSRSPADVFWAQEAGALEQLHRSGFLTPMPADILALVPAEYRHEEGAWVGTSGRARVVAYAPARVEASAVPASIFDLTDAQWSGRVGWAPTNASFQASVTAMRLLHGEERTRAWLRAMHANGAKAYANNTAVLQGLAAGEVDLGLTNHYYLLRFKSDDASFPVEQKHFEDGDAGNLINFAGVGILSNSRRQEAAQTFARFLLARKAQSYFATEVFEYPVNGDVEAGPGLVPLAQVTAGSPRVALGELEDVRGTLDLLREAGVL